MSLSARARAAPGPAPRWLTTPVPGAATAETRPWPVSLVERARAVVVADREPVGKPGPPAPAVRAILPAERAARGAQAPRLATTVAMRPQEGSAPVAAVV